MINLHIGLHKAGSTTVQTYLRDNAAALAKAGVLYPAIGRDERVIAHHQLAADVRQGRPDPAQWAAIIALAEAHPDQRVVISSEGFESCDPAVVQPLFAGHPVKVFCYHRDAAQRFVSAYGHGTKNGFRSIDFDQVFANQFTMKRTYIGDMIKGWADAFGPSSVRVRSLNPACLTNGDLMADVFEVLGLGADAEARLKLRKVGPRNISPGWKALEVLRAIYDDLGPGAPGSEASAEGRHARGALLKRALQAEAKLGLAGRGRYLTEEQMRRLIALEDADIAVMKASGVDCRLQPITMDGFEPRDFLPDLDHVPGHEAAALMREMLSSVVKDYVMRRAPQPVATDADAADEDDEATPARRAAKPARDARPAKAPAADADKAARVQAKAERQARRAAKAAGPGDPAARQMAKAEKQAARLAERVKAKAAKA